MNYWSIWIFYILTKAIFLTFMMYAKPFTMQRNMIKSLTAYFMDFKKPKKEFNVILPFSLDVKVQQVQLEQKAVMSFFASLLSVRYSHILFNS